MKPDNVKRIIFSISIIFFFVIPVFSQEKADSLFYKNFLKLDFVPLYDVFFDTRFQIRIGAEYERSISKKSSVWAYLDAGLYDKYNFIKYYDFFSQNQGLYSVRQKVLISGFHLLTGYNYCFYSFRKKPNRQFFAGALVDFGYYHKQLSSHNTLTLDNNSDSYSQVKTGIGLSVGFKNRFSKRFSYEMKTSMVAKVFNYVSESGRNPVRALDAQWTSADYNFWWISNIKIGYAF